jgi:hypothetical protein
VHIEHGGISRSNVGESQECPDIGIGDARIDLMSPTTRNFQRHCLHSNVKHELLKKHSHIFMGHANLKMRQGSSL